MKWSEQRWVFIAYDWLCKSQNVLFLLKVLKSCFKSYYKETEGYSRKLSTMVKTKYLSQVWRVSIICRGFVWITWWLHVSYFTTSFCSEFLTTCCHVCATISCISSHLNILIWFHGILTFISHKCSHKNKSFFHDHSSWQ